MKHLTLALLASAAAACVLAPYAAPANTPFTAQFQTSFGNATAHPCPSGAFLCGAGTVGGRGDATLSFAITGVGSFDGSCIGVTATQTISLADGSGSLTLVGTGVFCAPTASAVRLTNGLKSFGNPYAVDLDYTAVAGTGVFQNASGSGVLAGKVAGDSGHLELSGTT